MCTKHITAAAAVPISLSYVLSPGASGHWLVAIGQQLVPNNMPSEPVGSGQGYRISFKTEIQALFFFLGYSKKKTLCLNSVVCQYHK